ncbi:MAG: hypothetical protein K5696_12545, partial [Lachnospiraceae bacterium]|nr:hypothetical protein [Lachnospiraceae bacterium]
MSVRNGHTQRRERDILLSDLVYCRPVKEYDLLIRITRGGIPGDMSVQVSMDGGARWSEEQEITLAGNLPLYEQTEKKKQTTGLTAHF